MVFLKELFNGGALTFDQLSAAVKEKGFSVVNAARGADIPKADADNLHCQITTLTGQLGDANKKPEGAMIPIGGIGQRTTAKHCKSSNLTLLPEYNDCTTACHSWFQEILNAMDVPWANGFTEGCNNKTKGLKRICYGVRNFESFRKESCSVLHKSEPRIFPRFAMRLFKFLQPQQLTKNRF